MYLKHFSNTVPLVWCLTAAETKKFIKEKAMYNNLWGRCNSNCNPPRSRTHNKTFLNKELAKVNKKLGQAEKEELIKRRLKYKMKTWACTAFAMTEDQFQEQLEWFLAHGFKIAFRHTKDIKFRHEPAKYQFFFTYVRLIEQVLNQNIDLKHHIYGDDNDDFIFSELFLESMADFHQFHSRQIARTETFENIKFDSVWTLFQNVEDYTLSSDGRLPLDDPCKM